MRLLQVTFKPDTKHTLVLVLLVTSVIRLIVSLSMMSVAYYVQSSFQGQAPFLKSYYSAYTVPSILYTAGSFIIVSSFCGIYLSVRCQLEEGEVNVRTIALFKIYVYSCVFLVIYIFVTSMIVYGHLTKVEEALTRGLSSSLQQYRLRPRVKIVVDNTQIHYSCCGVKDYEDWFRVPWIDKAFVDPKEPNVVEKDGQYYTENVPFSCCDPSYLGECHNNLVRSNKAHYRYDYRINLTLFKRGCRDALMDFLGGVVLIGVGSFFFSSLVLEIFVCVISRYLQTSSISEWEKKDVIQGWLIEWKSKKKNKEPVVWAESEYDSQELETNEERTKLIKRTDN
ncbi:peripherin-2-like [Centruroides vittatus]|uniref:peripherin-2-like n=1 Tax=Centruroides vittatus TaxID=120091 RepID=UPI00350FB16D